MSKTSLRSVILRGGPIISLTANFVSPAFAEFAGHLGFNAVVIDVEHGPLDEQALEHVVIAASSTNAATIIREPLDPIALERHANIGVSGVQLPRVRSLDEIALAVAAVKYPPAGQRGLGYTRANRFGMVGDMKAELQRSNADFVIIAQIEDEGGVAALPEILHSTDVDVILAGPLDLSLAFGVAGDVKHPLVTEAIDEIRARTREAGRALGLPVATPADVTAAMDAGARYLLVSAARMLSLSAGALLDAANEA